MNHLQASNNMYNPIQYNIYKNKDTSTKHILHAFWTTSSAKLPKDANILAAKRRGFFTNVIYI